MPLSTKEFIKKFGYDPLKEYGCNPPPRNLLWADYWLPYVQSKPELKNLFEKWSRDEMSELSDEEYLTIWLEIFPDKLSKKLEPCNHEQKPCWQCLSKSSEPRAYNPKEAEARIKELSKSKPEAEFGVLELTSNKVTMYNRTTLSFLMETGHKMIEHQLAHYNHYYPEQFPNPEKLRAKVEQAFLTTVYKYWSIPVLRAGDSLSRIEAGQKINMSFGCTFWMDIMELFKESFWQVIGCPSANLNKLNDKNFINRFPKEWKRAYQSGDFGYDFYLKPAFSCDDMVRYASLAGWKRLTKEMFDFVALKLVPTLMPRLSLIDQEQGQFWVLVLSGLCEPLINEIADKYEGNNKQEQIKEIAKEIINLVHGKYNYLTKKKYELIDSGMIGQVSNLTDYTFRWVRPHVFVERQLKERFLGQSAYDKKDNYKQIKQRIERPTNKIIDNQGELEDLQEQTLEGALSDSQVITLSNPDGTETSYLTIRGLSEKTRVNETTLREWERKKIISCRWEQKGRRRIRLFPYNQEIISAIKQRREIQKITWQAIAKQYQISDRHLRRIKSQTKKTCASLDNISLKQIFIEDLKRIKTDH